MLIRRILWLTLNVVGVGVYLWLASALWVRPGEEGEPGGPGDAFYWLFYLVPILLSSLVINLVALFVIIRRIVVSRRGWAALALWLSVAAVWAGAVAYDQH